MQRRRLTYPRRGWSRGQPHRESLHKTLDGSRRQESDGSINFDPVSSAGDVSASFSVMPELAAALRDELLNVVICYRVNFCLTTTTIVLGISVTTLIQIYFSNSSKNRAIATKMTSEIIFNTTSEIILLSSNSPTYFTSHIRFFHRFSCLLRVFNRGRHGKLLRYFRLLQWGNI